MLGKLDDALRVGGVADEKTREAADEIAAYEKELAEIKSDVHSSNGSRARRLPSSPPS